MRLKRIRPSSVKREVSVLKNIFTKAVEWNIIKSHPVKKIKLPKDNDCNRLNSNSDGHF